MGQTDTAKAAAIKVASQCAEQHPDCEEMDLSEHLTKIFEDVCNQTYMEKSSDVLEHNARSFGLSKDQYLEVVNLIVKKAKNRQPD